MYQFKHLLYTRAINSILTHWHIQLMFSYVKFIQIGQFDNDNHVCDWTHLINHNPIKRTKLEKKHQAAIQFWQFTLFWPNWPNIALSEFKCLSAQKLPMEILASLKTEYYENFGVFIRTQKFTTFFPLLENSNKTHHATKITYT